MTDKKKYHVFSARTTEDGLKTLNELKQAQGVGWDELIINAVERTYNVSIPRIELVGPGPEERAKAKAEKETEKAAKAKKRADDKTAKAKAKAIKVKEAAKKKAKADKVKVDKAQAKLDKATKLAAEALEPESTPPTVEVAVGDSVEVITPDPQVD